MLVADLAIIWCAVFSSFYLRLGWDDFIAQYIHSFLITGLLCTIISLPVFYTFGLYRAVLRYVGQHVSFIILRACFFSSLFLIAFSTLLGAHISRSIPILYLVLSVLFLGLSRYGARFWLQGFKLRDILFSPIKVYRPKSHELLFWSSKTGH